MRKKEICYVGAGVGVGVENCRRIKTGLAGVTILLLALICRLFYIQVLCHEEFADTAAVQYEMAVEGLDTRGQIFDRNMKPLTGSTYKYYYILKTSVLNEECGLLLAQTGAENITAGDGDGTSGMNQGSGAQNLSKYQVFQTEHYIENVSSSLRSQYGAYVFRTKARYTDDQLACHLIGYLNDAEKRGVSGLELLCEERLEAGSDGLVLMADAAGNILPGAAPAAESADGQVPENNSVIVTIDSDLQRKCESMLSSSSACVVSDGQTGEILALASAPGFNPNDIASYLDDDSDCLLNKALQGAYAPGSVFKLVVAAAALESDGCAATRTFECTGEAAAGGLTVRCATAPPGGHGTINMYEAMAKSCNSYFVQLGELIGKDRILAMARNLGLGETVLQDYPEESEGNVPSDYETSDRDISNLSIGQGTLLVTPLQINRLTAIIAKGGRNVEMTLFPEEKLTSSQISVTNTGDDADSITPASFDNGCVSTDSGTQLISPETASELHTMMFSTAEYGTASGPDWKTPVWAKTGTAEARLRGQPAKHCWLTGFCRVPASAAGSRCYVITVFVEDGISGSATALPIFEKIVDYLNQ